MPKKRTLDDLPQDVAEHLISEYLTPEDKLSVTLVSKSIQNLFQPHRLQKLAKKLLLHVMHGEQEEAEKMLKFHPELLTIEETATDYSGRTFKTTAFRYALWALDTRYMCNMMLDCLPYSEEGEAIKQKLLTQYMAQTHDGLDYKLNGVTIHETHYDFSPIKAALQTYIDNHPNWWAAQNLYAMNYQWSKVVGLAQRYVPAHVAQHYCNPKVLLSSGSAFNKKTFVRFLEFCHWDRRRWEFWFAPVSPTSGLGVDFGIIGRPQATGRARVDGVSWSIYDAVRRDLSALTALCEVRTGDLVPLMQRLEDPMRHQCVIS